MPFVIAVDDRAEQRLAVRFNVLDDLHAWTSLDVSVEQRAPLK